MGFTIKKKSEARESENSAIMKQTLTYSCESEDILKSRRNITKMRFVKKNKRRKPESVKLEKNCIYSRSN